MGRFLIFTLQYCKITTQSTAGYLHGFAHMMLMCVLCLHVFACIYKSHGSFVLLWGWVATWHIFWAWACCQPYYMLPCWLSFSSSPESSTISPQSSHCCHDASTVGTNHARELSRLLSVLQLVVHRIDANFKQRRKLISDVCSLSFSIYR